MKKISAALMIATLLAGGLVVSAQTVSFKQDEATGLYGFVDENGRYITPPVYKDVDVSFGDQPGLSKVVDENDKIGFVNEKGKEVVPCKYDAVGSSGPFGSFEDGYIIVKIKSGDACKMGLMDSTGKEVVAVKYGQMEYYPKEKVLVAGETNTSDVGLMALNGKWIVPARYSFLSGRITKGLWPAKDRKNKYGILNMKNEIVVPFEYDMISNYSEELDIAVASKRSKNGVISRTGRIMVPFIYDAVANYGGPYLVVEKNKKSGIIDLNNKIMLPIEYAVISSINGDIARVAKNEAGEGYEIDLTTNQKVKR